MRRFLLRLTPFFILVLFTSFPFSKVAAYSVLLDEYGRMVLMGDGRQVLGEQFIGRSEAQGQPAGSGGGAFGGSGGGGGQQLRQPSQQQQQQQIMQQRPLEQYSEKVSGLKQVQQFQGKPIESSSEMQKKVQEMTRENGKQDQEFSREIGKQSQETVGEAGKKQQEVNREAEKNKREMMRIGVQNGELRVQPSQGGASGGFGQMGQNVESVRIRESAEKDEVEIRAAGNEIEMNQNNIRTRTRFPLSVNDKNEITVTTPKGTQTVTVLPEEAVKEAFRRGAMTSFGSMGQSGKQIEPGGNGDKDQIQQSNAEQVELVDENGQLEYKVEGMKESKLFGFFPVASQVETHISAETGAVTSVSQPWYFSNFGFLFR
ncbi:hypothetical protein HY948_02255 [Candidatus Gottesmanbacteria bacterium]|nr:hypothetical protein [Candidatus Gottesmanbacteria bacterium]